jgi:hypothetical protein
MIGPKVMSQNIEPSDPLSSAIAEFRAELLQWIDAELARLREREETDVRVVAEERVAERGSLFNASTSRPGVRKGSPYFPMGIGFEEPLARERVADRGSVVETAGLPLVGTERLIEGDPRAPVASPRERLDALARLLDHRLKQAQGPTEASRGGGDDWRTGSEHDTP